MMKRLIPILTICALLLVGPAWGQVLDLSKTTVDLSKSNVPGMTIKHSTINKTPSGYELYVEYTVGKERRMANLTFQSPPTQKDIQNRVYAIAGDVAKGIIEDAKPQPREYKEQEVVGILQKYGVLKPTEGMEALK